MSTLNIVRDVDPRLSWPWQIEVNLSDDLTVDDLKPACAELGLVIEFTGEVDDSQCVLRPVIDPEAPGEFPDPPKLEAITDALFPSTPVIGVDETGSRPIPAIETLPDDENLIVEPED